MLPDDELGCVVALEADRVDGLLAVETLEPVESDGFDGELLLAPEVDWVLPDDELGCVVALEAVVSAGLD